MLLGEHSTEMFTNDMIQYTIGLAMVQIVTYPLTGCVYESATVLLLVTDETDEHCGSTAVRYGCIKLTHCICSEADDTIRTKLLTSLVRWVIIR